MKEGWQLNEEEFYIKFVRVLHLLGVIFGPPPPPPTQVYDS